MAFEKLPIDPAVDQLIGLLIAAELHVQDQLKDAVSRSAPGSTKYYRRRMLMLHQTLNAALAEVSKQAPQTIEDAFTVGQHIAAPGAKLSASFGSGGSTVQVNHLVANMLTSLQGGINTLGRQAADVFRRVGLKQTALHMLETTTHAQAAKAMEDQLLKEGMTAFIDKAHRHWTLGNYSSMVIRTTTREAVTAGTKQGLTDTGRDLFEIFEHNDPCDICKPYRGNTYSLTGRVPGYPVSLQLPPFHPNCRCVVGPAKANFEQLEQSLGLMPDMSQLKETA